MQQQKELDKQAETTANNCHNATNTVCSRIKFFLVSQSGCMIEKVYKIGPPAAQLTWWNAEGAKNSGSNKGGGVHTEMQEERHSREPG